MVEFAYLVMISFMLFSPFLFWYMTAERALVVVFVVSLLWLPQITLPVPFLKNLSHDNIPCLCVLAGILIFGSTNKRRITLSALDIPVVVAPLCPMAASLTNDLGPYDGFVGSIQYFLNYSVPFLLGRMFLATPDGSRLLARSFILGAMTYVLPCLIEIRFSPQLHNWFFGGGTPWGGMRLGGYRPSVFMQNGLQLGIWMSNCAFVALCLFGDPFAKTVSRLINGKKFWTIFLINIACRSTGALAGLVMGIGAVLPVRFGKSRLGLIGLLLLCPLYMSTRLTGLWDGRSLVAYSENIDKDRAGSLEVRITNEDLLMAKALQRPFFGWGGWGRARVTDDTGKDISITDGRWIIHLGNYGLVGLFCDYWMLLLPLFVTVLRWPTVLKCSGNMTAIISISCVCTLCAIDFLSNNFPNPFYWLCAGAISGAGTFVSSHTDAGQSTQQVIRQPSRMRRSLQFVHQPPDPPPSVSTILH